MSKNDVSVAEKLKRLYELQLIDSELAEIETLKGELPMEVADLEDEVAGLQTRQDKIESSINEVKSDINKHTTNIKDSEALIIKYQKQLDNVKNNREFEALTKELELQKLEIQLLEKKIRELNGTILSKQETNLATTERFNAKVADLALKKNELANIIAKTEKEEDKLRKKSEKASKLIEERLLKAYAKIKKAYHNHLAVVTVTRNACGGCFNKIPPQLQLEIGLRKKIIACEHCGRILVDENILESNLDVVTSNDII
jgi:predicted  nucleic acid-binding Zn-ribbon protein